MSSRNPPCKLTYQRPCPQRITLGPRIHLHAWAHEALRVISFGVVGRSSRKGLAFSGQAYFGSLYSAYTDDVIFPGLLCWKEYVLPGSAILLADKLNS
jgi:hypothetical protein